MNISADQKTLVSCLPCIHFFVFKIMNKLLQIRLVLVYALFKKTILRFNPYPSETGLKKPQILNCTEMGFL